MSEKSTKRQVVGTALDNKMDKTATIEVERRFPHPVYNKFIVRTKKYYAHDESNTCSAGDVVRIEEYKPTSKLKRWVVVNIEKKAN
ncbi:MAG: 30S ribosomal protein S17 [Candidatus Marinimicrobia bacterium]|nr:30S ribosomal protein S17 [Candidatus Neomarinimicrobiota bacterium]|tara:strand:- start:2 stop:259 length:258 start_codon:yes stop_codon:yes gene_type:complete